VAFTQAEVDALRRAIAQGVRTVAYRDRTVTYATLQEMLQALQMMEAEVNPATTGAGRRTLASFTRD
jgi:hypothetical protein